MQYKMYNISNYCSAGCTHCPSTDSSNHLKKFKHNPINLLSFISQLKEEEIALITGGEPMESKELISTCETFDNVGIFFRIATGGFVNLSKFEKIFNLSTFTAISIGTDVLLNKRNPNIHYKTIWMQNAKFLIKAQIPHSVTVYYNGDIDIINELADYLVMLRPHFIMVLMNKNNCNQEIENTIEKKLTKIMGYSPIIFSYI